MQGFTLLHEREELGEGKKRKAGSKHPPLTRQNKKEMD